MLVGCKGHQKVKNGQKRVQSKKSYCCVFFGTSCIFLEEKRRRKNVWRRKKTFGGGENWRRKRRKVFREGKQYFCGGEKNLEKEKNLWARRTTKKGWRKTFEEGEMSFGREGLGVSCKWPTGGTGLLQMIIQRGWPLANDHHKKKQKLFGVAAVIKWKYDWQMWKQKQQLAHESSVPKKKYHRKWSMIIQ